MHYEKLPITPLPTPYMHGVSVIDGKWRSRILAVINYYTALRYTELREALRPISDTVLANQLRYLIDEDIIVKIELNDASVCYSLTEKGKGIIPVLRMLAQWSQQWGYSAPKPEATDPKARIPSNPFRTSLAGARRANMMFAGLDDDEALQGFPLTEQD